MREGAVGVDWLNVTIGTLVAAISGFFAIKLMIKLIVNKNLNVFAIYTLVLGILVLLDQFAFTLVFTSPLIG